MSQASRSSQEEEKKKELKDKTGVKGLTKKLT